MFLELSFDSRAGDKEVTASKASRSWRYDDDKDELSLDELISDLRTSVDSRKSARASARSSPLRAASPPKRSKANENSKENGEFGRRARPVERGAKKTSTARTVRKERDLELSDEESAAVMPTPRLDWVLKQRPTLAAKRRGQTTAARSKVTPARPTKPKPRSPVLSSPPLTPSSLSPVTLSDVSSPLSVSEDIYMPLTPDEDSIDALIGKDIRDLSKLISIGRKGSSARVNKAARSPADEISNVLRRSTRFRTEKAKGSASDLTGSRSSFQLAMPTSRARSAMLESPPPPPPPEDDDEEDSFTEEIRKLRESRRLAAKPAKAVLVKEEPSSETSEICATAALKVRNASNAINDLLLEALKPFEERRQEEAKANERESGSTGDAVLRQAASAELQSATKTIVSQLDLAFAEMTERRNADQKAEADASAAAKEKEKQDKETADEKKKAEEKEAKEHEMEILRLIPMQGKLLTCPSDIESVLEQLDSAETASSTPMETAMESLRSRTQQRIREIEARMETATPKERQPDQAVSWRAVDWRCDPFEAESLAPVGRGNNQLQETEEAASADVDGQFEEVLQRQVVEKLDLTMLKLKHVLAIDSKEAADAKEKLRMDQEEKAKNDEQKRVEDERRRRALEDAESARRRVMGLTSLEEVEGWMDEGRQLHTEFRGTSTLEALLMSIDNRMDEERTGGLPRNASLASQADAMLRFDRLTSARTAGSEDEEILAAESRRRDERSHSRSPRRFKLSNARRKKAEWSAIFSSDSESDDTSSAGESDEGSQSARSSRRYSHKQGHRERSASQSLRLSPEPFRRRQRSFRLPTSRTARYPSDSNQNELEDYAHSPRKRREERYQGKSSEQLQQDVARTIFALQSTRRQRASWVKRHLSAGVLR